MTGTCFTRFTRDPRISEQRVQTTRFFLFSHMASTSSTAVAASHDLRREPTFEMSIPPVDAHIDRDQQRLEELELAALDAFVKRPPIETVAFGAFVLGLPKMTHSLALRPVT